VIHAAVLATALTGGVAACTKGPSNAEFVQACVKTQATQAMCECGAREARSKLSSKLYTAMVLDMQGKKPGLEALTAKMTMDERAAFAMQQFQILGKCMPRE
jgi:hypothetical protein